MVLILSDLLVKNYGRLCQKIKESRSIEIFKRNVKFIKTLDCSCKLCKDLVPNLGFLQLIYFVNCNLYILYSWP